MPITLFVGKLLLHVPPSFDSTHNGGGAGDKFHGMRTTMSSLVLYKWP